MKVHCRMKTLFLTLLSLPLMAQYTTISDTIYTPFATTDPPSTPVLWSGRIEVYAQCSMSYQSVTYERGARVVAVNTTGAFTIRLIPNQDAVVTSCFNNLNAYLVKYLPSSGGNVYEQYWSFAASATPLTIAAVKVAEPAPATMHSYTVGTALPAFCTVGDLHFKTDATAGQMVYECSATDTWTQESGGGGGGMSNPMTTLGDVIYGAASGTPARLAGNTTTTRRFLRQTGTGAVSAAPAWDTFVAGDIPNLPASIITSGQIGLARGGTNADLSATGGTGQVLKQLTVGGAITVAILAASEIPSLDTAKITSGTFADDRIASSNVTQHQALLSIGWSQLTGLTNVVTNSTLAQMPANRIKCNNTGSTADAIDCTVAQIKTLLAYASTDLSDTANLARTTTANTFGSGLKQVMTPSATTAGFNPGSRNGDPSSPANGDMYYDTGTNKFRCYENGAWANCVGGGGGSGTVTTVSVASANGFAGSVANPTTTPAITISTTVTGLLKGDGTAMSAASAGTDYVTPAGNVATATALAANPTDCLFGRQYAIAIVATGNLTCLGVPQIFDWTLDGGGSVLTASVGPTRYVRDACGIDLAMLNATDDLSGSVTVIVEKAAYTTGAPSWSTISSGFALSSARALKDTTLTSWTLPVAADSWLRVSITGTPSTITKASVTLRCI